MALPIILVDSATGSDTLASGAGPSSALTGTAASTSGDGLTVTLDGSPDLTNVATDGSHVIFLEDTTAGARNFGKITAKDNGAKTVTVSNAFGISLSGKNWAIGGKRASIAGTTSKKLFENNSAAGDALTGWIVQMASGHSESFSTGITFRRSGDTSTDGPIQLRGDPAYSTRPALTCSGTGTMFAFSGGTMRNIWLSDFSIATSSGTPGIGIDFSNCDTYTVRLVRVICNNQGFNKVLRASNGGNGCGALIDGCYLDCSHASAACVDIAGGVGYFIRNSYIRSRNGHGLAADSSQLQIYGTVFDRCGGSGISYTAGAGAFTLTRMQRCLIYGCTSHGWTFTNAPTQGSEILVENTGFVSNGGYGINIGSSPVDGRLIAATQLRNCGFYNNTSGVSNPTLPAESNIDSVTSDPQLVNPTGLNFTPGTNWVGVGLPTLNIGVLTSTRSYVDIGAVQRPEVSYQNKTPIAVLV